MSKHRDYTKFSNQNVETTNAVAEIPVDEPVEEVVEQKIGMVTNCITLNVRKEPDSAADVICCIPCLTEVVIDDTESTNDFYKVCTPAGIEGFCMSKFIAVRK